jgi:hypothetical protein
MLDIPQCEPSPVPTVDHPGHHLIGLADQFRLAGRRSDATAMIDMAFQHFDSRMEQCATQAVLLKGELSLYHSNDNGRTTNRATVIYRRHSGNRELNGTAPYQRPRHVPIAPVGQNINRKTESNMAKQRPGGCGETLRQLVLRA